ncbi:MAG: type II toxin-antitoxin system VapC family toxin [Streptosporangiales bacterium]
MSFLLDTNVLSELRKPVQTMDRNVCAWAAVRHSSDLFLSVITVPEVEVGIGRVERKDRIHGQRLRTWLEDRVLGEFEDRLLPVDLAVAQCTARLHVPDPRSERDALIAATALVHGLTMVTRNVADFEATGVRLINPWLPTE